MDWMWVLLAIVVVLVVVGLLVGRARRRPGSGDREAVAASPVAPGTAAAADPPDPVSAPENRGAPRSAPGVAGGPAAGGADLFEPAGAVGPAGDERARTEASTPGGDEEPPPAPPEDDDAGAERPDGSAGPGGVTALGAEPDAGPEAADHEAGTPSEAPAPPESPGTSVPGAAAAPAAGTTAVGTGTPAVGETAAATGTTAVGATAEGATAARTPHEITASDGTASDGTASDGTASEGAASGSAASGATTTEAVATTGASSIRSEEDPAGEDADVPEPRNGDDPPEGDRPADEAEDDGTASTGRHALREGTEAQPLPEVDLPAQAGPPEPLAVPSRTAAQASGGSALAALDSRLIGPTATATPVPEGSRPGPYSGSILAPADGADPPESHRIKVHSGSRRFHSTESPYYVRTRADLYFSSEASARGAGFIAWHERPGAR
ncbi:hypothetical protein WIS52_08305 [Pseudonocardia nematodicida]|uniref:Uncharacterized protein n=1 Tax=Pseudonocardia nematodicida TaxID=1206997 RepID=A0ABV1K7K1_9PSEU